MNLTPFILQSIGVMIATHFISKYLAETIPNRGYWFWFTIISFVLSLFLM